MEPLDAPEYYKTQQNYEDFTKNTTSSNPTNLDNFSFPLNSREDDFPNHLEDNYYGNNGFSQTNFSQQNQLFETSPVPNSPPSYNQFLQNQQLNNPNISNNTINDPLASPTNSTNSLSETSDTRAKPIGTQGTQGFENETYTLKDIRFNGKKATIIMQNKNGPCPLLAIANVLLLSNNLSIRSNTGRIRTDQLLTLIGEHLTKTTTSSSKKKKDFAVKLEDAMSCLPAMQYGLQFNAKFGNVRDFERTKEFSVFELLEISIVHGWIVDPSNKEAYKFISPLSYDTLMDKVCLALDLKEKFDQNPKSISSSEKKEMEKGLQGKLFLDQSASQLTFEGLIQLHKSLKEGELCVFFRNNHFGTMLKRNKDLYLLITDDGYSNKPNVVWERLAEVGGDTTFVDSEFIPLSSSPSSPSTDSSLYLYDHSDSSFSDTTFSDHDHALALKLQEEEKQRYKDAQQRGYYEEEYTENGKKKKKRYRIEERTGRDGIVRRYSNEEADDDCKIL